MHTDNYFDSDEEVAWGQYSMAEAKKDILSTYQSIGRQSKVTGGRKSEYLPREKGKLLGQLESATPASPSPKFEDRSISDSDSDPKFQVDESLDQDHSVNQSKDSSRVFHETENNSIEGNSLEVSKIQNNCNETANKDFLKVPEKPVRVKTTPTSTPSKKLVKTPLKSPLSSLNLKFKNVSPVGCT